MAVTDGPQRSEVSFTESVDRVGAKQPKTVRLGQVVPEILQPQCTCEVSLLPVPGLPRAIGGVRSLVVFYCRP